MDLDSGLIFADHLFDVQSGCSNNKMVFVNKIVFGFLSNSSAKTGVHSLWKFILHMINAISFVTFKDCWTV